MGLFNKEQIPGKNKKIFFFAFATPCLISSKKFRKTALIVVCLSLLVLLVPWWFVLCNTAIAMEQINTTITHEYFSGETDPATADKQPLYSKHAILWKFLAIRISMRDEKAKIKKVINLKETLGNHLIHIMTSFRHGWYLIWSLCPLCLAHSKNSQCFFFFNPPLRIYLLILEREEGKEREREREIETLMWERNMDWLPPICSPIRDQTHNLLVLGAMFQPTVLLSQS